MEFDKQQIVALLEERGEREKAGEARRQLPETFDHEEHQGLLGRFGVDPQERLGRLG